MDSLDKVLVSNFIVFIVYKQPICHAYYVFAFLLYFRISIKLIKDVIYIVKKFSYFMYVYIYILVSYVFKCMFIFRIFFTSYTLLFMIIYSNSILFCILHVGYRSFFSNKMICIKWYQNYLRSKNIYTSDSRKKANSMVRLYFYLDKDS